MSRGAGGLLLFAQQALVEQGGDAVQDVDRRQHAGIGGRRFEAARRLAGDTRLPATTDRLGGFERAPAGEDRQPSEQHLLRLAEQVDAPGDGAAQRLVAQRLIARAAGQQRQAAVHAHEHGFGRQQSDASGRQLDAQWQAVESMADLGHGRRLPR